MEHHQTVRLDDQEQAALRRFVTGSLGLGDEALARLMRHGLVERQGHGARLTPLGRHSYRCLPKAILQLPISGDPIEAVLSKYTRQFQSEHAVTPPRVETRGRPPRELPRNVVTAPVMFFDSRQALERARAFSLRVRAAMRRNREDLDRRVMASRSCLAASHRSLARSAHAVHASSPES